MRYLLLFLILSGCSASSVFDANIFSSEPEAKNVRLFLSRAHLHGTDFEHYQLSNNKLLFECGSILNNRFRVKETDQINLDSDIRSTLLNEADAIKELYTPEDLPEPGSNKHLADPGKCELRIWNQEEEMKIKTSLDAVSAGRKNIAKFIRELGRDLRKTTGKDSICGNASFYGFHDSV